MHKYIIKNNNTKKMIITNYLNFVNEQIVHNIILYRGVEDENYKPDDNDYSFFAESLNFASDYGDFIWKCKFINMNLFISYKEEFINELYNNGLKLKDEYIEFNWDNENIITPEIKKLYRYDKNSDNNGYLSAHDVIKSPYFHSDTWEMIEKSHGVLDYILSKYDGVILLEGGQKTYFVDTSKMVDYELL